MRKLLTIPVRYVRWCFSFGRWPWSWVVGICLLTLTVVAMETAARELWAVVGPYAWVALVVAVLAALFGVAVFATRISSPKAGTLSGVGRVFASRATLAADALANAGIKRADGTAPRVRSRKDNGALLLFVQTPTGCADADIVKRADVVAAELHATQVSHDRTNSTPGWVCLRVQETDALASTHAADRSRSRLEAVPFGWAEDGHTVAASLDSATVLIGGSPGSGKSIAVWSLLLGALRDSRTGLLLIDLKPSAIETAALHDRAEVVASTTKDALSALRRVWRFIEQTNAWLLESHLAKVPANTPRLVIVVDEAAELAYDDDGKEAAQLLQRIVAVGRASGVSVILATQKPSGSVIPTDLRDLFGQRLCFRVGNAEQAKTVLGPLPEGVEPWNIPLDLPGTGYAVGTTGETAAVRFRGYALTDTERDAEARALVEAWRADGSPCWLPAPLWDEQNAQGDDDKPKQRRRRR